MFTRILVPTDFSPASDAALVYARALAHKFGGSLFLLHVLEDPILVSAFTAETYVPEGPEVHATRMEEAQRRLAHRLRANDRSPLAVSSETVVGNPVRAVTEYAALNGISLIVMGTHGRGGMAHLLLGSVAERVVRTAPCPVLTVRQGTESASTAEPAPELA